MAPLLRHAALCALAVAAASAAAERGDASRAGGWPEAAWAGQDECSATGGCSLALLQLRARGAPADGGGNGTAPGEADAAGGVGGGLATEDGGIPGGWGREADSEEGARNFAASDEGSGGNLTTQTHLRTVGDEGRNVKILYHQTSIDVGPLILLNGFKLGYPGDWCGSGIYFAAKPEETNHKTLHHGYMVMAGVDVGRVSHMSSKCNRQMTGDKLRASGFDSITFNPGDGVEYVVYSSARVLWTKRA